MTKFSDINLNAALLKALADIGHESPTPIQERAIPILLQGNDLLGIAQTGTGKTGAFLLPILDKLASGSRGYTPKCAKALILTPTRELASQIHKNIQIYGKHLSLFHGVIYGGVSERPQIQNLRKGIDILVATPGRLIDLMHQKYLSLTQVEMVVLDEADRMLDMGFMPHIQDILSLIPEKRQSMLFSATLPPKISSIAEKFLKSPVRVEITPESTAVEKIEQKIFHVAQSDKSLLLKNLLDDNELEKVLVFSRTKHGAERISNYLRKNEISATSIHGDKSQKDRDKALERFRNGNVRVLVATDVASRGIDVLNITHVINYDIPEEPDSYIHRIGRTGRAGKDGVAISFCDTTEYNFIKQIERITKAKPAVQQNPDGIQTPIFKESKNYKPKKSFGKNKIHFKKVSKKSTENKFRNKGSGP